jgi:hypothetical protein
MKSLILSIGLLIASIFPVLAVSSVSAQFNPLEKSCEGVSNSEVCNEANQGQSGDEPLVGTNGTLITAANILALVGGVIAVIVIVVAGITMTLSQGDSNKVSDSQNAIIYASVGILTIVIARGIVLFLINRIG